MSAHELAKLIKRGWIPARVGDGVMVHATECSAGAAGSSCVTACGEVGKVALDSETRGRDSIFCARCAGRIGIEPMRNPLRRRKRSW